MKLFATLCTLALPLLAAAQSAPAKKDSASHMAVSETFVGIWRNTGMSNAGNGRIEPVKSGNYKVLNADGSYYSFVVWNADVTTIGQYGTYTITSDSTMVEHVLQHAMNPSLTGKESTIRYKMIDKNTLIIAWSLDGKTWWAEEWSRLPVPVPNVPNDGHNSAMRRQE